MNIKARVLYPILSPIILPLILTLFIVLASYSIFSQNLLSSPEKVTEYIQFDAVSIGKVKQSLNTGQAAAYTKKAYLHLIQKADTTLQMANPSVMNKLVIPPSNDKHDYISLSRYWWPDPKSENGLPWIRKDGVTNPTTQNDDVDRRRLGRTVSAIRLMSLAYYFSDEEKYAQKVISLIDTWFLNVDTKMNPHLKYAQSVPGNSQGRRSGILDGRIIPERVLDAITMVSKSPSWTNDKALKMNAWLTQYLSWLTTSKLGIEGAKQPNNHGSWYRFQVASLAWYLHNDELLEQTIIAAHQSLPTQFNKQGAQEHELERTRGFFYSCFNLQALAHVANIAEKTDLPLWRYKSRQGHSLKLAVDYLMPVTRGEKWPHASKKIDLSQLAMVLGEMVPYTDEPKYQQALSKILTDIGNKKTPSSHEQRIYNDFALLKPDLLIPSTLM